MSVHVANGYHVDLFTKASALQFSYKWVLHFTNRSIYILQILKCVMAKYTAV